MNRKAVSVIMFTMLSIGMLTLAFNIQLVKSEPRTIIVPRDYPTIQEAVNNANEGDTVFVSSGTYFEHVVVNKAISLIGENKSTTNIDGGGSGTVVYATSASVHIVGLTIRNGTYGIHIRNARGSSVVGNIISNNLDYGIYIIAFPPPDSRNCYVADNIVVSNGCGIFVGQLTGESIITGNTVSNNVGYGICLHMAPGRRCIGNIVSNNGGHGIIVQSYTGDHVTGNRVSNNSGHGIFVGPWLWWAVIDHNIVSNNGGHGIFLAESGSTRDIPSLYSNEVSKNFGSGIYVEDTINAHIDGNRVSINNGFGIFLHGCSGCWLRGNNMTNNSYNFRVSGGPLSDFLHNIDTSNVVNKKPVYYLVNQLNLIVDNSTFPNIGYLALVNSKNVTLRNLNLTRNGQGIVFAYSNNSIVEGVTTTYNQEGIYLVHSTNDSVCRNTISNNEYGIFLDSSDRNLLYHNNLVDNTNQVSLLDSLGTWDDGYPSGGNYWSDYKERYPNATEIDGSGIWDTPYIIDENNQDNYPLMHPWGISPEEAIRDLIEKVKSMNLQQGIDNSLDAKLDAVLQSLEALNADQRNDAVSKLQAFINEVEAQRGKKLTSEQADYLISEAQRIIDLIQG